MTEQVPSEERELPEEVALQLAEQERMLKSIRRWVQLWRTSNVSSTSALQQIAIDFDTASRKYV